MSYYLVCTLVFAATYLVNITYITVFYHRGLTHSAVTLKPWLKRFVAITGNWITGLDPKGWSCMHRMHHLHSDTPLDPHSPANVGILPVAWNQLFSYNRTLVGLLKKRDPYHSTVADLDFPVSFLIRHRLWYVPYVLHAAVWLGIGLTTGAWLLGYCYWLGMMSHPLQGWMVNSFGHAVGYRNFETPDQSRNNTFVAWFVMGEGYQNNHHEKPRSAKFSVKWFELDMGYGLCLLIEWLGLIQIDRSQVWEKHSIPQLREATA